VAIPTWSHIVNASQYYVCRCGLLLQTKQHGLSVTVVSPMQMAELIEMPFGFWTWVGPRNHVLDGVQIPDGKGQFFVGKGHITKYRYCLSWAVKTAEPIEIAYGMLSMVYPRIWSRSPYGRGQFSGEGHAQTCMTALCHQLCSDCWTDRDAFGLWTRMGPRKPVLYGFRSPIQGAIFRGKDMPGHAWRHSAMSCAKMAEGSRY